VAPEPSAEQGEAERLVQGDAPGAEVTPPEIRMRCLEAAAKNPLTHKDGFAAGILESAKLWAAWVEKGNTLGVPKKGVEDLK
jgi:hypothetical protein